MMTSDLLIDRRAPVRRMLLGDGSWVDLVDGFVRDAARALTDVRDHTAWQQQEVLRYDGYVPERRPSATGCTASLWPR